jgi:hypothetical protein
MKREESKAENREARVALSRRKVWLRRERQEKHGAGRR